MDDVLFKIDGTSDYASHPFYKETNLLVTKPKSLQTRMRNSELLNADSDLSEYTSQMNISNKNWHTQGTCVSSQTCSLLPWKLKYNSSFFSMNPTQDRNYFYNLRTMHGGRDLANYGDTYFDFASVKDPHKEYADKLSGHNVLNSGNDLSVVPESPETY